MTEEQKALLLKDLCARLPYKSLISINGERYRMEEICNALIGIDTYKITVDGCSIDSVKPYLFPLSSMTEEQRKEYDKIIYHSVELHCERYYDVIDVDYCDELQDFYHKNHFDYRGLIPMGIVIDATGLNIY